MNSIDVLLLNFKEIRRRSIKVWGLIPAEEMDWRPDENAMSIQEMIRHVLEGEFYYHWILLNKGSQKEFPVSPFKERPFVSVEEEIKFAEPFREKFLHTVSTYTEDELSSIKIDRSDAGYIRTLGDMLARIAYHESIHTGQMLQYLRMRNIERADIWD